MFPRPFPLNRFVLCQRLLPNECVSLCAELREYFTRITVSESTAGCFGG